jgi:hypothetical protein
MALKSIFYSPFIDRELPFIDDTSKGHILPYKKPHFDNYLFFNQPQYRIFGVPNLSKLYLQMENSPKNLREFFVLEAP